MNKTDISIFRVIVYSLGSLLFFFLLLITGDYLDIKSQYHQDLLFSLVYCLFPLGFIGVYILFTWILVPEFRPMMRKIVRTITEEY